MPGLHVDVRSEVDRVRRDLAALTVTWAGRAAGCRPARLEDCTPSQAAAYLAAEKASALVYVIDLLLGHARHWHGDEVADDLARLVGHALFPREDPRP